MRQSDVLDSEPDYLLRPTRHWPGGTLLDSDSASGFLFRAQVTNIGQDLRDSKLQKDGASTTSLA